MKIAAISDIHVDIFVKEFVDKTVEQINKTNADVLLIGGDLAQSPEKIREGLRAFNAFPGRKLAYLGNHEVNGIHTPSKSMEETINELDSLYSANDFQLLDKTPYIEKDIGFVGSVGWFDFSLYKGQAKEEMLDKGMQSFRKHSGLLTTTPADITYACIERMQKHMQSIENKCEKIVLGIHHIAFPEFLKYAVSPRLDYLNLFMGSELFQKLYVHPKVAVGLCGHTHRSGEIDYAGKKIYNLSSDKKMPFRIIEL